MLRSIAVFVLLLLPAAAFADSGIAIYLEGKIIEVQDGDSLTMLDAEHNRIEIRLTDLDAPETPKGRKGLPGQPFSKAARTALVQMSAGREASAECYEQDRFERWVCRVFVDDVDLSLALIERGFAWANGANKRYVRDPRAYSLEAAARAAGKGLWSDRSAPVPPWKWRKDCWRSKACDGAGE